MKPEDFFNSDPLLKPYADVINSRIRKCVTKEKTLAKEGTLADFALGHYYYGLHRTKGGWVFREWAPNATDIYLTGTFNDWQEKPDYKMTRINAEGDWEITLAPDDLSHGDLFKLSIHWTNGRAERIPSYANRAIQDSCTKVFSAQVWNPSEAYKWKIEKFTPQITVPLIYEAHIGMASSEEKTGSYREFTDNILPRVIDAGYNVIQLMAIQEHPFYGSFGYHVSNFFAASSRFGTPEELKELIDKAHEAGIAVIMDLVHSHSVKNANEGLALFDGSPSQYFHTNTRRIHKAWDSLCFDYGKDKVIHFLLSNCRYWLEEYKFDGFRFDGITSMIYYDHGLERNFTSYGEYFNGEQDENALIYLYLANNLIHQLNPSSITIAEEMSGMPGIASSTRSKGYGFDYRLSMGVPDFWIKLVKETHDEEWDVGKLMYELTTHRPEEKTVSYCESHDQALVGDQTLIFRMLGPEMYTGMNNNYHSFSMDRGIALHKIIKLMTFCSSSGGYLNFMGNEFGHPEWIDFPREGNNWSYKYARRQWNLLDNRELKYASLALFDKMMLKLQHDYRILDEPIITKIYESAPDKVVAFSRGDYLFVFNLHPANSYTDYGIPAPGKFTIIMDTDDSAFGGFNRIDRDIEYLSIKKAERNIISAPICLYLYLPSRTALVFRRKALRKATDI